MDGAGVLKLVDGRQYEGGFVNGLEHGKGCAVDKNGTRYEGEFHEGQRNGRFVIKDAKGNVTRECVYNMGVIK